MSSSLHPRIRCFLFCVVFWRVYKKLYNSGQLCIALLRLQVLEQGVEKHHDHQANDGAENNRAGTFLVKGTFRQDLVHNSQNYRVQILQSRQNKSWAV